MEFDQILALRKSIRSYTDEPVSKEDLAALVKAALASSVGKHNDAGYTLCVVTDPALLSAIDKEAEEKLGKPHMFFEAPALIFICETKEAFDYLKKFDAGIIAEHIHLKASDLVLGSVVLYGFIRHLGHDADYVKALDLPEGTYPLLAVAVGHSRAAKMERKGDREFEVIYR